MDGQRAEALLLLNDSQFNEQLDQDKAKLAAANSASGEGSLLGGIAVGLGGLLPGLGGAVAGMGLLGGTGALALGGITSALSAAHQASQNVGMTSQQVAAQNFSNAVQITQANEQVQQSQMNLASVTRNAAASQVQALQSVTQAEQQVQQATYNLSEANYNLGQAYVQAREQIVQLNDQLADSKLNVQSAQLAIQQAIYQQTLVDQDAYSTSIDRAQAALAVQQAQQQLKDSQDQLTDSQNAANLANQQGVDGSQTVIQAKQAQLSAQDSLTDANNSYTDAQTNLTNTELNNAEQIKQAQQQVAEAEQNVTDTIEEQKLQWASMESTENSAANQFLLDMSKLTPAGRSLVNQILGLSGAYDKMKAAAQNAVVPGFSVFVSGLGKMMPAIQSGVTQMGGAISKAFGNMGRAMESSGAQKTLEGLFANGMQFADTVLPALSGMAGSIMSLGSQKGAVSGLADLIKGIAQGVSGFAKGLKPYIPDFDQLFEALGKIAKTAGPAFAQILGSIAKDLAPLAKFLNSKAGAPFIDALGKITAGMLAVKGLAKILPGELGKAVGGAPGAILKAVTAPLEKTLKSKLSAIFKSAFGGAAKDGEQAAQDEVSNSGGMSGLLGAMQSKVSGGGASAAEGAAEEGGEAAAGAEGAEGLTGMLGGLGAVAGPIGLIGIALAGLAVGVYEAYKHVTWFRDAVNDVFHAVEKTAMWLWHDVFDPVWQGISQGAEWLYDNGIKPYFDLIQGEWKIVEAAALWLWHDVFDPVWHGIGDGVSWLYGDVIKPYFDQVKHSFTDLENAAMWLWHNVFDPVWQGIESGAEAFVSDFGRSWDKLDAVFKTPVNFLITTVYDNGIAKLWNDVVGAVGLGSLKLPSVAPLARGGVLPGYAPGHDTVPALLSPGEGVLTPGATRAIGASTVHALNAAYPPAGGTAGRLLGREARKQAVKRGAERPAEHILTGGKFAGGGIVQRFSLGGIVSGLLSGAEGTGKAVAALATGNTTAFVNAIAPAIGTSAAGALGQLMAALPKTLVTDAAKSAMGILGGSTGAGGSLTPQVQSWFAEGVKAAGVPVSWIQGLEEIAQHESGYNPRAVNSTAAGIAAGTPEGIMQTVIGTFQRYHVPGTGTSPFDPVADIAAAARYIGAEYGSPVNTPGLTAVSQGKPYTGYDSGGWLPTGVTAAVNQTGKPEAVLNPQQSQALESLLSRPSGAAGQAPVVNMNYYGPQEPTAEQKAIMMRDLCLALSGG